jgi:hypothetical protein
LQDEFAALCFGLAVFVVVLFRIALTLFCAFFALLGFVVMNPVHYEPVVSTLVMLAAGVTLLVCVGRCYCKAADLGSYQDRGAHHHKPFQKHHHKRHHQKESKHSTGNNDDRRHRQSGAQPTAAAAVNAGPETATAAAAAEPDAPKRSGDRDVGAGGAPDAEDAGGGGGGGEDGRGVGVALALFPPTPAQMEIERMAALAKDEQVRTRRGWVGGRAGGWFGSDAVHSVATRTPFRSPAR